MGFDEIEIHAAHGYLVDQFFQDDLNTRDDRYGGATLSARSRFAVEIVNAVRARVGPDFPVLLRLSQWKPQDFSARLTPTPQALEEWLGLFVAAGVDAFDISERYYGEPAFPAIDPALSLAGGAKKVTGITVIALGPVGLAEDAYRAGRQPVQRAEVWQLADYWCGSRHMLASRDTASKVKDVGWTIYPVKTSSLPVGPLRST